MQLSFTHALIRAMDQLVGSGISRTDVVVLRFRGSVTLKYFASNVKILHVGF